MRKEMLEKVLVLIEGKETVDEEALKELEEAVVHDLKLHEDGLARAKSKREEKYKEENKELLDEVLQILVEADEPVTASQVSELTGIKVQKASSVLIKLMTFNPITKEDIKIPKKGVQKGYSIIK